jgi:hypothetical protein
MEVAIQGTKDFISILKSSKGVSRDMNDALDRHIQVMRRILDANCNIANACFRALEIADADALHVQPSLA